MLFAVLVTTLPQALPNPLNRARAVHGRILPTLLMSSFLLVAPVHTQALGRGRSPTLTTPSVTPSTLTTPPTEELLTPSPRTPEGERTTPSPLEGEVEKTPAPPKKKSILPPPSLPLQPLSTAPLPLEAQKALSLPIITIVLYAPLQVSPGKIFPYKLAVKNVGQETLNYVWVRIPLQKMGLTLAQKLGAGVQCFHDGACEIPVLKPAKYFSGKSLYYTMIVEPLPTAPCPATGYKATATAKANIPGKKIFLVQSNTVTTKVKCP